MHKATPKKHVGVLSYGVGYNTYAPEAYTGFQKAAKGNDMIDAYLYNKTINPSYGVKKINVDYGPHENYVRKIYPYKDIPDMRILKLQISLLRNLCRNGVHMIQTVRLCQD